MENRIINRLKKTYASPAKKNPEIYEFNIDEMRNDTITGLKNMALNANQWAIRDSLCRLTKRNYYPDKKYDSLSENDADKVIDILINFVASQAQKDDIIDIYEAVERFI